MALEYGYFDSEITGYDEEGMPIFDRAKTSDFMADFFSKLITSGVLADPADCFQVMAHTGMTVQIKPGYGFIKGRFAYDRDPSYLTLEDAPTVSAYKRIDMVILRNNYAERKSELLIKTGTPAANPKEPEILQPDSGDYYELCLATIYINSNQSVISQANITDTRFNDAYCGPVTQLIDHLDTSVFFAQLTQFYKEFVLRCEGSYSAAVEDLETYIAALRQAGDTYLAALQNSGNAQLTEIVTNLQKFETGAEAAFLEWFQHIKDQLGEDAAGSLQNQIDALTQYLTAYAECETGIELSEKIVTCGNFLLMKGATVRVKFTALNDTAFSLTDSEGNLLIDSDGNELIAVGGAIFTLVDSEGNTLITSTGEELWATGYEETIKEQPTLNVNGSGAYPIYYRNAPAPAGYFCLDRTYDFVFNGEQYEIIGDLGLTNGYKKKFEILLPSDGTYQIMLDHSQKESCCGLYIYHTQTSRFIPVKAAAGITLTANGRNIKFECKHAPVLHYTQLS